jgi:hypothetical protein
MVSRVRCLIQYVIRYALSFSWVMSLLGDMGRVLDVWVSDRLDLHLAPSVGSLWFVFSGMPCSF